MQAYWMKGRNPFLNLSIEDAELRKARTTPCLMLWQNDPCVVIGRGQNPWQECDLQYLEREHIPLVRRQTGGGTVYHDAGNLNISLIHPGPTLDKKRLMHIVAQALDKLGCHDLDITERGDIKLAGHKIVGSAYRVTSTCTLHHVSLLFDANLSVLARALNTDHVQIQSKGVPSVRSSVTTIKSLHPKIGFAELVDQLRLSFFDAHQAQPSEWITLDAEALRAEPAIHAREEEYKSWEWRFGKTPAFTATHLDEITRAPIHITVEKGRIQHIDATHLSPVQHAILEKKYGEWYTLSTFTIDEYPHHDLLSRR
jgi:lipoate-protein ligase A